MSLSVNQLNHTKEQLSQSNKNYASLKLYYLGNYCLLLQFNPDRFLNSAFIVHIADIPLTTEKEKSVALLRDKTKDYLPTKQNK